MMKQPELGQKLTELRQHKNMTQEDLVEACNVSVRTIQRIESGEVTPRVSTIKIIIAALGEEIDVLHVDTHRNNNHYQLQSLENWMQLAWICGIVSFILGIIESGIEYSKMEDGTLDMPLSFYYSIKLSSLASYVVFLVGMIKLGDFFENRLLPISCYLLIGISTCMTSLDVLSIYWGSELGWITIGTGLLMGLGAGGVVFGVGLLRLQDAMGQTAKTAGILEIIGGICLITVLLAVIGLIIYIPAIIMEVILLYKGYEYIRAEKLKTFH